MHAENYSTAPDIRCRIENHRRWLGEGLPSLPQRGANDPLCGLEKPTPNCDVAAGRNRIKGAILDNLRSRAKVCCHLGRPATAREKPGGLWSLFAITCASPAQWGRGGKP